MIKPFKVLTTMVSRIVVMSSAIVLALILGTVLQAHELRPAVAKVEVSETELKIELLVAIETLLAGIDLTEILDTDEAPEAAIYDTLRGLDDDCLLYTSPSPRDVEESRMPSSA